MNTFHGKDLPEFLRAGTRQAHAALDAHQLFKPMRSRRPRLPDWLLGYQVIAKAYIELLMSVEASQSISELHDTSDIGAVADAYSRDLAALERDGMLVPFELPPTCTFTNPSQVIGAQWCLHGARHGARVMFGHATEHFGATVTPYIAALRVQNDQFCRRNSQRHSKFKDVSADRQEALIGAIKSFEYFGAAADSAAGEAYASGD